MTGETTARDRAIEAVAEHRRIHRSAWRQRAEIGDVVDALLAHPEVLRALAGAPTADVAATPTRSAAQTEFLLSSAIGHAEQPGVLPEGVVEPIQHLLRNVIYYRSELAGSWIAAAGELAEEILSIDPAAPAVEPEGMDVADEQDDRLIRRAAKYHRAHLRVHGDEQAAMAATLYVFNLRPAPEGMDAKAQGEMVDQPKLGMDAERLRELAQDRDARLMDALVENDEMADELTAAQAALEEIAAFRPRGDYVKDFAELQRIAERALDGDTTEES